MSATVQIRDKYLAQLYRENYSRWEEANRLGLAQLAQERMFPSTDKQSSEGERQAVSPLGGKVW